MSGNRSLTMSGNKFEPTTPLFDPHDPPAKQLLDLHKYSVSFGDSMLHLHRAIEQYVACAEFDNDPTTTDGRLTKVEEELEKCDYFTAINSNYETALHLWLKAPLLCMSSTRHRAITKKLCTRLNCKTLDNEGNTPLHVAARHQAVSVIRHVYLMYSSAAGIWNANGYQPIHVMAKHRHQHKFWSEIEPSIHRFVCWDSVHQEAKSSNIKKNALFTALSKRNWNAASSIVNCEWETVGRRYRLQEAALFPSHDVRGNELAPGVLNDYLVTMFPPKEMQQFLEYRPHTLYVISSQPTYAGRLAAFFAACRLGHWTHVNVYCSTHFNEQVIAGQSGLHTALMNVQPKLVTPEFVQLMLAPASNNTTRYSVVRESQLVLLGELGFPLERVLQLSRISSTRDWHRCRQQGDAKVIDDAESRRARRLAHHYRCTPRTLKQLAVVAVRNSWPCVREETVEAQHALPLVIRQQIMLKSLLISEVEIEKGVTREEQTNEQAGVQ